MDVTAISMPAAEKKKRFGLIAARIGSNFQHKIGIEFPLDEPMYSTMTAASTSKARTSLGSSKPRVRYGVNPRGGVVATALLPGATIQLTVQDFSRLDPELRPHVRWVCNHPDCAGHHHASKDDLIRSHGDNRDLIEEAERSPVGRAHTYYGVLEVAAKAAAKDEKTGKVTREAEPPTLLLLSDEE